MSTTARALDAALQQIWTEDMLASKGLPEAGLEVVYWEGAYYAVLNARTKCRWMICRLPGLPKDERFLGSDRRRNRLLPHR